jgi:hypothetical protein
VIAASADSLIFEVHHPNPAKALSNGSKSLTLEGSKQLMLEMALLGKLTSRWTKTTVVTTATPKFAPLVFSTRHLLSQSISLGSNSIGGND